MTKEEKELLIDLCARSPYGVMISFDGDAGIPRRLSGYDYLEGENYFCASGVSGLSIDVDNIKPYLRPMSSMTEEEKEEYIKERDKDKSANMYHATYHSIDWLNKHHFDYRMLIEKGLAIEAPEGMYNTK